MNKQTWLLALTELNLPGSTFKVIGPAELAQYGFNVGLVGWLMDKVG